MKFAAEHGAVVWLTGRGTIRLSEASADQLLDLFEREGAIELFNELWQARVNVAVAPLIPVLKPITLKVAKIDWPAVPDRGEPSCL